MFLKKAQSILMSIKQFSIFVPDLNSGSITHTHHQIMCVCDPVYVHQW